MPAIIIALIACIVALPVLADELTPEQWRDTADALVIQRNASNDREAMLLIQIAQLKRHIAELEKTQPPK